MQDLLKQSRSLAGMSGTVLAVADDLAEFYGERERVRAVGGLAVLASGRWRRGIRLE